MAWLLPRLRLAGVLLRDALVLFACLWAGKAIAALLPFSFPGSILGMLLLFVLLNLQVVKLHWVEAGAGVLLRHMALLFIPVGVGLLAYLDAFADSLLLIVLNVLAGITLILLVVGRLYQRLNK